MVRTYVILLVLTVWSLQPRAQVGIGWLPEIYVSYQWDNKWRVTGQLESMQQGWEKHVGEDLTSQYKYIRTDLTLVLSYRLNPNWSLAGGTMFRALDNGMAYRTLQQISYATRGRSPRFGHRFRTDQTFADAEYTEYRFRYRFSFEVPLQGSSLDDDEWYWISSVEQLGSLERTNWDWEQRFLTSIGHYFDRKNKIEVGLDYRLAEFIQSSGWHQIWLTFNYFVNL